MPEHIQRNTQEMNLTIMLNISKSSVGILLDLILEFDLPQVLDFEALQFVLLESTRQKKGTQNG